MKRAATTALLVSLVAASAAMADSHYDRSNHRDGREQRQHREHRRDDYRNNYQHYDRRDNDSYRGRYRVREYYRPHGYYHRDWRRGDRLPRAYYSRPYVLYNYSNYGLRRPPRGHHWVRVDNDALLAVIATGVVLDIVYNNFY